MIIKKRSYPFTIRLQDVDFQHQAPMSIIVDALLSAAIHNADDNSFGLCRLNEMKSTWTLIRLAVEMETFPRQYDEITVETWVEKVEQLMTTRNFLILNQQGEILGKASSHWVMIDLETRRLKDLSSLKDMQQYAEDIPVLKEQPAKLPHTEGDVADSFKVKYSAIDINGHVNSIRYIEWICNCFPLEAYREKKIKRFEINYLHELLFDDFISISVEETQTNDFYFEIRKNDKAACRARVVFDR